jgi:hypothetical protein
MRLSLVWLNLSTMSCSALPLAAFCEWKKVIATG